MSIFTNLTRLIGLLFTRHQLRGSITHDDHQYQLQLAKLHQQRHLANLHKLKQKAKAIHDEPFI